MFKTDPLGREYPAIYSHNIEVVTKSGQARFNIPDSDYLSGKILLGVYTRKQISGNTRKSKNGYTLISNTAMDCAFVTLEVDNKRVLNDYPLSHLVHEGGVNTPGTYLQILINQGFDPSTSIIRFTDTSVVEDNKAVELVFLYAESGECNL